MTRALDALRASFESPPADDRPLAAWHWNGDLREAELNRQLIELRAKGLGGAVLQARPALRTPYLGERWWDAVGYTVGKGARAGFKIWFQDELGSPSGSAGPVAPKHGQAAPVVLAAGPVHHAKSLVRNIIEVDGPAQVSLEGRYPAGEPVVRIGARLIGPGELDPASFVNLTKVPVWSCPTGAWRVFAFAVRTSDDRIDCLRADTVRRFLDATYEAYAERYGDAFGKGIPGIYFDAPHLAAGHLPWTTDLPAAFLQATGYALLAKLPMLVYRAGPETVRVRCDFYRVVAAMYEEAWFHQISAWCAAHGLLWAGHTEELVAYHPARQGDYFRTMRHAHVPSVDALGFRFARPRTVRASEIKNAVSVAALAGRKRVMARAFGGAGWGVTLGDLRRGANLLAVLGVDTVLISGFFYTLDSAEAADDWPSSYFYQNPYWEHFGAVSDYLSRLSTIVNQSRAATSIAVLCPVTSVAANTADGRPNTRAHEVADAFEAIIDGLFGRQVDVHVVDEAFVEGARLKDAVLTQGAVRASTVILPPTPVMSRAVARRLAALVREGGTLVAVGEIPSASPDAGGADRTLSRAMRELFGPAPSPAGFKSGRGRAHALPEDVTAALPDLVRILDVPVALASKSTDIALASRTVDGGEIILIANCSATDQTASVATSARGPAEVWDPETGGMQPLAVTGGRGRRTFSIPILAGAARVVVFDTTARAKAVPAARRVRSKSVEIAVDWQFALQAGVETRQGSVRKLELPVMRFADFALGEGRLEQLRDPRYDDSAWRQLWLKAPALDVVGNWRASWITGVRKPDGWIVLPTSDDHERLRFTKTLTITEPPIKAWATFSGVDRAAVYLNGTPLGESQEWNNPVTYNIMPYLRLGENTIVADVVRTSGAPISLIFESQIDLRSGETVVVVSDRSWEVASPRTEMWTGSGIQRDVPIVTWERGRPPVKPWGHVPLLGEPVRFPRTLMYRQNLPVGCVGIAIPVVKGEHGVFVDVRERTPDINGIYNITTGGLLSIEVEASDFSNGILAPLEFYTRPTAVKLKPWSELGYAWYSGTGVYERSFELTAAQAEGRLILDLGDVRHHVEVILNNRRIGRRVWPPYTFDVTGAVQKGNNTLRLRVSNLLTNEMRWRRDELHMGSPWHLYWHEDNIEPASLVSGLLGPVVLRIG